ncbi:hypothetical protein P4S68_09455 [Pseudoalteromonas sp. Hal099]
MELKFLCPYWGCEGIAAEQFVARVLAAGFDGAEINFLMTMSLLQPFNVRLVKITLLWLLNSGWPLKQNRLHSTELGLMRDYAFLLLLTLCL